MSDSCAARECTGPLVGTWKITTPAGETYAVTLCAQHAGHLSRVIEWGQRARTRQTLTERLDDLWIEEN